MKSVHISLIPVFDLYPFIVNVLVEGVSSRFVYYAKILDVQWVRNEVESVRVEIVLDPASYLSGTEYDKTESVFLKGKIPDELLTRIQLDKISK